MCCSWELFLTESRESGSLSDLAATVGNCSCLFIKFTCGLVVAVLDLKV